MLRVCHVCALRHLKDSLFVYLPHRWKASSSVRDTSSFASSSELRSSRQVSSWAIRWRSIIRPEVDWDAVLDVLSERARGMSNTSHILLPFVHNSTDETRFNQTKSSLLDPSCILFEICSDIQCEMLISYLNPQCFFFSKLKQKSNIPGASKEKKVISFLKMTEPLKWHGSEMVLLSFSTKVLYFDLLDVLSASLPGLLVEECSCVGVKTWIMECFWRSENNVEPRETGVQMRKQSWSQNHCVYC